MIRVLESRRRFAPLGLEFWDAATDVRVREGLVVRAGRADAPSRRVPAVRTVSGIYAFHRLPGLRALTHPDGPADEVEALLPPTSVLIRVDDPLGRFLPMLHRIELPLPERGPYRLGAASPPAVPGLSPPTSAGPKLYLFPSPRCRPSPGLAAVRVTLQIAGSRAPAAHALVDVRVAHLRYLSVADHEGRVAVLFPYPPITTPLAESSPPTDVGAALRSQEWELAVRVFHDPDRLDDPLDEGVPELRSVLAQRSRQVALREEPEGPGGAVPVDVLSAVLSFGEPCVLRTSGLSVLLIESP